MFSNIKYMFLRKIKFFEKIFSISDFLSFRPKIFLFFMYFDAISPKKIHENTWKFQKFKIMISSTKTQKIQKTFFLYFYYFFAHRNSMNNPIGPGEVPEPEFENWGFFCRAHSKIRCFFLQSADHIKLFYVLTEKWKNQKFKTITIEN